MPVMGSTVLVLFFSFYCVLFFLFVAILPFSLYLSPILIHFLIDYLSLSLGTLQSHFKCLVHITRPSHCLYIRPILYTQYALGIYIFRIYRSKDKFSNYFYCAHTNTYTFAHMHDEQQCFFSAE